MDDKYWKTFSIILLILLIVLTGLVGAGIYLQREEISGLRNELLNVKSSLDSIGEVALKQPDLLGDITGELSDIDFELDTLDDISEAVWQVEEKVDSLDREVYYMSLDLDGLESDLEVIKEDVGKYLEYIAKHYGFWEYEPTPIDWGDNVPLLREMD